MDAHSLKLLEFDAIRDQIAGYAACQLGKDRAWAMEPSYDLHTILGRQAFTTEMSEALSSGLTPPLGGLRDIRALVRRAKSGASLTAEELGDVVETLRAIAEADLWLERVGDQFPRLGAVRDDVGNFQQVTHEIEGCLDARGTILDTASRRLSNIRQEIGTTEEGIREKLRHMLRSPAIRKCLRYPNFTTVGPHYVLPVNKDYRSEIPGAVHRTSATNETVFVEPTAIAEHSASLSYLRTREAKEIRRILRWLSAQVGRVADPLLETIESLSYLDLVHACGRYSLDYQLTPPDLNEEGHIFLTNARHPLLLAIFRQRKRDGLIAEGDPEEVIPIDVHLGFQHRMMIITGPNTGGKTVAIKTLALLAVMAQTGLHIPAGQGSKLPIFDQVLCDIGDEQSLQQSLSTFSSHIKRISQILEVATEDSLILLDEMGAGTDPAEGAVLGRSLLDEFDAIGCLAIVTTHIGELKTYAFGNARAVNAAVEFDDETLRPLYRLRIGDVGRSNALKIARRLQLPGHLVDRASGYLEGTRSHELPEWEQLQDLRREAEEAKREALEAKAEAQRMQEMVRQKLDDLQRQSENDNRVAEARERLKAGDRVVVERFGYDRPGRVVKVNAKRRVAVVAIGQMQWDVKLDEIIPQVLREPEVADRKQAAVGKAHRLEDFD